GIILGMVKVLCLPVSFLSSEDGTITVDWVVLTTALAGIGLGAMMLVSGSVGDLSNDTRATLNDQAVITNFPPQSAAADLAIPPSSTAWTGGTPAHVDGLGLLRHIAGGETATVTLDIPGDAAVAMVTFDLIGGDDLDGDLATVLVNGQPVSVYRDDHGVITTVDAGVPGVAVAVTQRASDMALGANAAFPDSRATFSIRVDDPGQALTLGVHSGADEPMDTEFYAIGPVQVRSL
ncbi:MAG: hypothetical protein AAFQ50_15405, partial [Pseudomonadota bacterium]